MAEATAVVVLGSSNLDLFYTVDRLPAPGETAAATRHDVHLGGKGNNQALAARRAGATVTFITAVGFDTAGDLVIAELAAAGIGDHARRLNLPTGTAVVLVDQAGENSIVVNPGANGALTELTTRDREAIGNASILLMQLEIPLGAAAAAGRAAREGGTLVVLNAAPALALPREILGLVDVLVVNEHEALVLGQGLIGAVRSLARAGEALRTVARSVIITRGSRGAMVWTDGTYERVPAPAVVAVDTTAAGDTFCGYLVAGLVEGMTLLEATRLATSAAAISVTRSGSVSSIPHRFEVDPQRPTHP